MVNRQTIYDCSPDNSFIAVTRFTGMRLRHICELPSNQRYVDLKKVLIASIKQDREIVPESIMIHEQPSEKPGSTGKALADFAMRVHIKNHSLNKRIVFLCKLIEGCPHHDGSLPYTLLLINVFAEEFYRVPMHRKAENNAGRHTNKLYSRQSSI